MIESRAPGIAEIDLMDIVRDVRGAHWSLLAALAVAIVLGGMVLAFGTRSYQATAVLGPTESSGQQGGLSASLGQMSGAASLLGVNLGGGGATDMVKFRELLTSERLAVTLFRNDRFKSVMFGPEWDNAAKRWRRPSGIVFAIRDFVHPLFGQPRWSPPEPVTLQQAVEDHLNILTDKITNYTTLNIDENSPEDAVFVLQTVIETADGLIREDVKRRAAGRIAYLSEALQQTSLQDQRAAIMNVMSTQERTLMMSSVDKSYAVDAIDPAWASPIPSKPTFGGTVIRYSLSAVLLVALLAVARGFYFRFFRGTASDQTLDAAIAARLRRLLRIANSP